MKRPKGNDIFTYLLPLSSFFMPAQIKFTQTQRSSTRTRPKTRLLLFEGIANPTRDNVCVPKLCQSYTVIHYTKKSIYFGNWAGDFLILNSIEHDKFSLFEWQNVISLLNRHPPSPKGFLMTGQFPQFVRFLQIWLARIFPIWIPRSATDSTMCDFHNFGLIFTGQCTVCPKE